MWDWLPACPDRNDRLEAYPTFCSGDRKFKFWENCYESIGASELQTDPSSNVENGDFPGSLATDGSCCHRFGPRVSPGTVGETIGIQATVLDVCTIILQQTVAEAVLPATRLLSGARRLCIGLQPPAHEFWLWRV